MFDVVPVPITCELIPLRCYRLFRSTAARTGEFVLTLVCFKTGVPVFFETIPKAHISKSTMSPGISSTLVGFGHGSRDRYEWSSHHTKSKLPASTIRGLFGFQLNY
jgi:hypothetical protein